MLHILALEKLIHEFSRLPGIGPKTAQRLAYHVLKCPPEQALALSESLVRVHREVHECPQCFNYTDLEICKFCTDPHRQNDVLCVVEDPSSILRIESSGAFRGRYHVLHGAIAPLEGVGPENLRIKELFHRLNPEQGDCDVHEIIFALDADLEGDTTVLYLTKQLTQMFEHNNHQNGGNYSVKLTRIAHGVPMGSDIDYVDERTMGRALENRVNL